ncbi:hypothetical protein JCM10450v2_008196 [Rhodotorula kratochvilovae]
MDLPPAALPASPLAAALSTHSELRAHLDEARAALYARKRQRTLYDERTDAASHARAQDRKQELSDRLHSLRDQLAQEHAVRTVEGAVTKALDHAHLVSSHLSSLAPASAPTASQAALSALLARRDALSLSLLTLTSSVASLSSERALLRRSLLRLNRTNASLVASLRASHALSTPAARTEALRALPAPTAAYYSRLQTELPALQARLAVLQGVLTRLIAESGVILPPPPTGALAASSSAEEELARLEEADDAAEWSPERVWRVLLLAGSAGAALSAEFDDSADGEVGWEHGQTLPAEVGGAAAREGATGAGRRGAGGGRPERKEGKKRSRTVG